MDNLQHIDDLLKRAAREPANALVTESDWNAIEKKLKQRKHRIYALWFFVAFVVVSSVTTLLFNSFDTDELISPHTVQSSQGTANELDQDIKAPELQNSILQEKNTIETSKETNGLTKSTEASTTKPQNRVVNTLEKGTNTDLNKPVTKLETINHNLNKRTPSLFKNIDDNIHPERYKPIALLGTEIDDIAKQPNTSNNESHLEIGFAFTPTISNKVLSESNTLAGLINRNYYNYIGDNEGAAFANSYGIHIQYHSKNSFFFGTGLFMAQRSENVNYNYTITDFPIRNPNKPTIDSYGILVPSQYRKIQFEGSNSYHFIEIPLNLGYKQAISRNFEIRSKVGVSYLGLLSSVGKKGDSYDLELKELSELNFNTANIGLNLRTGVYYNTPNFTFGVEPVYSRNLNSFTDLSSSSLDIKPYNYGLNISTNFKIYRK